MSTLAVAPRPSWRVEPDDGIARDVRMVARTLQPWQAAEHQVNNLRQLQTVNRDFSYWIWEGLGRRAQS